MSDVRMALLTDSSAPDDTSKSFLPFAAGSHFTPSRDLPTPMLTLDLAALEENILAMAAWCRERGVELAPHGKTTMAPQIWRAQCAAGATGITVATPAQARVAAGAGVPLIVVANEVVDRVGLAVLTGILAGETEVVCWVDSVAAVEAMNAALASAPPRRPLSVCVELGAHAARTGARDDESVAATVDAALRSPHLRVVGFSTYEGSVPGQADERLSGIRALLARVAAALQRYAPLLETPHPVVTAGGSAWFDIVVDELVPAVARVDGARLILRSGAYVLHDDLHYAHETPASTRSGPDLRSATTLWAHVVSVPEPGLAILDAGKRDVAYDIHLPAPRAGLRVDGTAFEVRDATITATNDQHAYMSTGSADIRIGDLIEFGQAHPCTIADKWRDIPVVTRIGDDAARLDGFVTTRF